MNDSIPLILVIVIFGVLLLWGAAKTAPFLLANVKRRQSKMSDRYFTVMPITDSVPAKRKKAVQGLKMPEKVPQLATVQVEVAVPPAQIELRHETTVAPPTPKIEFGHHLKIKRDEASGAWICAAKIL